eukprot:Em0019g396a
MNKLPSITSFFSVAPKKVSAQPAILTEGGNDKPVVAMDPETPTCGDIPVVASTHTDECDVEMSAEDAEANAWLGSVNDQPTRLSWEQSVSREEESVLLDEYPPAEKMACQSPVASLSKEACIPAPLGRQLRELLDSYGSDVMSIHQDMLKAKHQVDILTRYHELRSVPAGLVFQQETHIKDPASWFTKEWREIEKKAALEKTNLLIRHWKEVASCLEGNALKAKYTRTRAIKQAEEIDEEAKTGLLNELSRAEETLLPDKEAMDDKQKRLTEAYLKKLVGPAKVHATSSRPGLGAVGSQTTAPKSTYAQMVANKGKGPASSQKPPTSSTKVAQEKSIPVVASNPNAAVEATQGSMRGSLEDAILQLQEGMKEIIQEMESIKRERRETKPARHFPQPWWRKERDRRQGQQGERDDRTPPYTSKEAQSGSGHGRPRPGPYPPRNRREYGGRGGGGGPGRGRGQRRGT